MVKTVRGIESLPINPRAHYELFFPQIGFFRFNVTSEQFEEIIKGVLWGILRDFESTDNNSPDFQRGEMLIWKIIMFYSKWHVHVEKLRDFYAECVEGNKRTNVKVFGIPNPYKKKKELVL